MSARFEYDCLRPRLPGVAGVGRAADEMADHRRDFLAADGRAGRTGRTPELSGV